MIHRRHEAWFVVGENLTGLSTGDVFRLESLFPVGGQGEVYIARRTRDDRTYALKTPKKETWIALPYDRLESFEQCFRDESHTNVVLGKHPNVVQAFWFESGSRQREKAYYNPYLVMEYVEGDRFGGNTLSAQIGNRIEFTVSRMIEIAVHCLTGLLHAQLVVGREFGREFVHQDIKPPNVMMDASGTAKLGDFGLAKAAGNVSGRTIGYDSPEQRAGAEIDQRTDVYAMGCVLAEMILRRPLFRGTDDRRGEAIAAFRPQSTTYGEPVPSDLRDIILRCLAERKEDRVPTVRLLRDQLQCLHERMWGSPVPVRDDPESLDAEGWFRMGLAFDGLGICERAISCYDTAIGMDPLPVKYYCNKGACLCMMNRFEEAISLLESSLNGAKNSDAAKALVSLGYARLVSGNTPGAMRDLESAENMDDALPALYMVRGIAHSLQKQFQAAEQDYMRASRLGNPVEANLALGNLHYYDLRDLPGAIKYCEQALRENPLCRKARELLEMASQDDDSMSRAD